MLACRLNWIVCRQFAKMSITPSILVAHSDLPQPAIDLMRKDFNVTVLDTTWPTEEEVLKVIPNYDALLGKVHIDSNFLDKAGKRLKVISTPSAGYDHMDIDAIKKRGIKIGSTPGVLSAAVAEIAIFLLLGAVRRTNEGRILLEEGNLKRGFQWLLGHDLCNKTVGIVGFGNIGLEVAKRLVGFEIKTFLYSGHREKPEAAQVVGAKFVTQDQLLKESDFVINCLPLTSETENLFNDEIFGKMKNSAVFVNIGRGKTVDTNALVRALKNNTIFAAGLDVTEPEPLPTDHEIFKLPNAVIIPHMGSATIETRTKMAILAAQNVISGLKGEPLPNEV